MKNLLLFSALFLFLSNAQSQNVGIGTTTPAGILDVVSTTNGVLFPRLTTAQMNAIVAPANGLMITNVDSANRLFVYNGTGWRGMSFTADQVNDTTLVHKGGDENIYGNKVFLRDVKINELTVGNGGGDLWPNTVLGFRALESNTTGNYNAALGYYSQFSNIIGQANLSAGSYSLYSNTTGSYNSVVGEEAYYSNTTGESNTGNGYSALYYNTTGSNNISVGFQSANNLADGTTPLTVANNSIFIGANTQALGNNQVNQIVIGDTTTGAGSNSVVLGNDAISTTILKGSIGLGTRLPSASTLLDISSTSKGVLFPRLTTAQMNAIVAPANGLMITNVDSANRLFVYNGTGWRGMSFTADQVNDTTLVHKGGDESIYGNKSFLRDVKINELTVGNGGGDLWPNTVLGFRALESNTTGNYNAALGYYSQFNNTIGQANLSTGSYSLYSNTTGSYNSVVGEEAYYSNTTGESNTGNGYSALYYNTTGSNNISVGFQSANNLADGTTPLTVANNSIFIGANTQALGNNQTNQIVIGDAATGAGSNSVVLGNDAISLTTLKGQVTINNSSPSASAQLDISSTTKGVLLPRMTKTQRDAIVGPVQGLIIYQTDNTPGLRVYNGTNWIKFTETID